MMGFGPGCNHKCWLEESDSVYNSKEEPAGFPRGWDVRSENKRKVKGD